MGFIKFLAVTNIAGGFLLCLSIIGLPVGFPMLVIGCLLSMACTAAENSATNVKFAAMTDAQKYAHQQSLEYAATRRAEADEATAEYRAEIAANASGAIGACVDGLVYMVAATIRLIGRSAVALDAGMCNAIGEDNALVYRFTQVVVYGIVPVLCVVYFVV